jgi:PQQ enzyme repeat
MRRSAAVCLPFVTAWAVPAYLHALQVLAIRGPVTSNLLLFALFLPVVAFEYAATRAFFRRRHPAGTPRGRFRAVFAANLAFWILGWLIWVLAVTALAKGAPGVRYYFPEFYVFAFVLWRSMLPYTLAAIVLWLAAHYVITVRLGRFRLATTVMLPLLLTFSLFLHQFHFGGLGGRDAAAIAAQPGVTAILTPDELSAIVARGHGRSPDFIMNDGSPTAADRLVTVKYQPRGILFDPVTGRCTLFFGCTYCSDSDRSVFPVIVQKDLAAGTFRYVLGDVNIRQVDADARDLFIAPWKSPFVFVTDRNDLNVRRRFPAKLDRVLEQWEPMSVLKDVAADRLYVGNEMHPALASYALPSGELLGYLDLQREGYIPTGGTAYTIVQSPTTRRLYFIGLPGNSDILEVDPDRLVVTRTLDLHDPLGTALILDDAKGKLYYQSGIWDNLYEIDISTWKVTRTYSGEFHARRLRLDPLRPVIYILGYASGRVTALNLTTGRHLWRVKVGGRAHGMALAEDALYVHTMAGAFRLELPTIFRDAGFENLADEHAPGAEIP